MKTIFSQLTLALVLLFLAGGWLLVDFFQRSNATYADEVQQHLHQELAAHMVADNPELKEGKIHSKGLSNAFHTLMLLGPAFEIYALNNDGEVLVYSEELGELAHKKVDLTAVKAFIRGDKYPVYGVDPRSESQHKIFSASDIHNQSGKQIGYLYVILGGEKQDSILQQFSSGNSQSKVFLVLLLALPTGLILLLILFAQLTKPLSRLNQTILEFKASGFTQFKSASAPKVAAREIQQLHSSFDSLAEHVSQQFEQIKSTDDLRRELLSHISHDLKTPLASMMGYLETWLLKHPDGMDKKLIEIAQNNAKQLHLLVEQLLELAQLENSQISLDIEAVAIAELAQDVLNKFALQAQKQQITLSLTPKISALQANADIGKLERVMSNLVDNALRHTPDGGEVWIKLEDQGADRLKIEVGDTGTGIPEQELNSIFNAHYRASNKQGSQRNNFGLGLTIVWRLLELHKSEIRVKSQLGKGTQMSFELPMANIVK